MSLDSFFVNITSPTRSIRHNKVAIDDFRYMGHQVVYPRHMIDIDLHNPEIRHGCTQVRTHHGRQMTVEIMRRDIHLMGICNGGDFLGLPSTVPGYIDNRNVHGLGFKILPEFANPV